jgi:hypothetical protein
MLTETVDNHRLRLKEIQMQLKLISIQPKAETGPISTANFKSVSQWTERLGK